MAGNKKREDRRRGRNRPDILRNRERLLGSLSLSLSLFPSLFCLPSGHLCSLPRRLLPALRGIAFPPIVPLRESSFLIQERERERGREGGGGRGNSSPRYPRGYSRLGAPFLLGSSRREAARKQRGRSRRNWRQRIVYLRLPPRS